MATLNETLTNLGDAVREKTGLEGVMTLSAMATAIAAMSTGSESLGNLVEFENGSVTLTSSSSNYTIDHSMSQTPNFVMIYCATLIPISYYMIQDLMIIPRNATYSDEIVSTGGSIEYTLGYSNANPPSTLFLPTTITPLTNSNVFTSTQIKIPSTKVYKLTRYTDDSTTVVDGNGTNTAYKWCRQSSNQSQNIYFSNSYTYYWIAGKIEV